MSPHNKNLYARTIAQGLAAEQWTIPGPVHDIPTHTWRNRYLPLVQSKVVLDHVLFGNLTV